MRYQEKLFWLAKDLSRHVQLTTKVFKKKLFRTRYGAPTNFFGIPKGDFDVTPELYPNFLGVTPDC